MRYNKRNVVALWSSEFEKHPKGNREKKTPLATLAKLWELVKKQYSIKVEQNISVHEVWIFQTDFGMALRGTESPASSRFRVLALKIAGRMRLQEESIFSRAFGLFSSFCEAIRQNFENPKVNYYA